MCDIRFCICLPENHKMHIAHVDRSSAMSPSFLDNLHFEPLDKGVSHEAEDRCRSIPFGSSRERCDIRFCIYWPEQSQDAYRASGNIRTGGCPRKGDELPTTGRCAIVGFVFHIGSIARAVDRIVRKGTAQFAVPCRESRAASRWHFFNGDACFPGCIRHSWPEKSRDAHRTPNDSIGDPPCPKMHQTLPPECFFPS